MKKITLLLLFLLGSIGVGFAQFSENFDASTALPTGWSVINNGDANTWNIGLPGTGQAHSGTNVARIYYSATAHDDYLITPQFDVTLGVTDFLTIWARNRSNTFPEPFDILLSNAGNTAPEFTTVIATAVNPTTSWAKYTYDLSAYAGQTVYIAFHSTTTDEWQLYLDDISVGAVPTCIEPSALVSSAVTATGATLTWTASTSNPANGYDYYYDTVNTAPNSSTVPSGTVTGGATTVDLTGLTPSTTYYYWVRSNCSASDQSIWISGTSFTTPALPPANDDCANAIDVTCGSVTTGTTTAATNENAAVCGISGVTTQNTPGVWYKFSGDGSDVTVTTCSSNITSGDSRIAVFSGSCGSFTCVGGNDDSGTAGCSTNSLSSTVAFSTVSGTDYYILVYAYSSSSLNFELSLNCSAACSPATSNDDCATALTIPTDGTVTSSDNLCASASLDTAYPSCSGLFNTYYDTWFSFDTGTSTDFNITLANPTGTTGFVVYSGTCGALTQVTGSCNTGAGTAALTGLTPSSTYYIRAFSTTTANRGSFDISVSSNLSNNAFDNGSFSYYPNPVKNVLNLSYNQEISNVEIVNLLGQKISSIKVNSYQTQIDMSNLTAGTYIVKVTSNGLTKTIKVTKE